MDAFLQHILATAIVVITILVVWLVHTMVVQLRKVGRAADQISRILDSVEEELNPTIKSLRAALDDVDGLISGLRGTAERIVKLASGVESAVGTRIAKSAAAGKVRSSAVSALSLLEGIKQGFRALRR